MKFLCLPGAYGSAKNFKVQLGPLAEELEKRGLGSFTYSQGTFEVEPPVGWEDYFGSRPLYRFLDTSKGDAFETLRRLRHVPRGMNPEETMRQFKKAGDEENKNNASSSSEGEGESPHRPKADKTDWQTRAWRGALDGVFKTIEEDEEIDAIVGYSEGAMVGASLVLEEGLRFKRSGTPRRIKFAIFISGAPPLKFEGNGKIVPQLFDESGTVIDIPTYHIFGCDDAFLSSAVALFNVCDQENAMMYDHGLGHIVPRDVENVTLLGQFLGDFAPRVEREWKMKELQSSGDTNGKRGTSGGRPRLVHTRTGSETSETDDEEGAEKEYKREREMKMLSRARSFRGRSRGASLKGLAAAAVQAQAQAHVQTQGGQGQV
ncbi:serine hydrolase-domain-containing protein [Rhypophila decipiens]|uniref:Serine hydrolase-domain-containing protein n=1 Tax=Rhypophila decipiens TaxID=261697 RepID=A0AAN6Y3A5_9PEZI|nr:serine hydrolase-domain-containing protein [Rhypophila decipiens]